MKNHVMFSVTLTGKFSDNEIAAMQENIAAHVHEELRSGVTQFAHVASCDVAVISKKQP